MIYAGKSELHWNTGKIDGTYTIIDGESFYRIVNYDQMHPFFMTIVSDSDHWMFISSNGALSAGRKNPEQALFPYYTDDKIHNSKDITGSKALLLIQDGEKQQLWEPFSDRYSGVYNITRSIYKNVTGNKIIFDEANHDLGLTFRYGWHSSERFGWVKKSELINNAGKTQEIRLMDGIQNILPYGVDTKMQNERSTLLNAYKKSELVKDSSLALFLLSSIPVDKAEPSEALKATTVWSAGLEGCDVLISSAQVDAFRSGSQVSQELDVRGECGAYFLHKELKLDPGQEAVWFTVAELNQGPAEVVALRTLVKNNDRLINEIEQDIQKGTENLIEIVGAADGLQCTANPEASNRHFSNVLFNVMRGGVFIDDYEVQKEDFITFIKGRNRKLYESSDVFFSGLTETINYRTLQAKAIQSASPDLVRNVFEYLPITFSRRHGDPSRPWNMFSIDVKHEDGATNFSYQGNWRDIFQNWEALSLSFPGYLESMIFKFLNATTLDGYNPYRIHREGLDWEVVDPEDPWSYIGYWGDHQIIYLLKLMELSHKFHRGRLAGYLNRPLFAFANVPYRIKKYEDIVQDPNDTIVFDEELDEAIEQLTQDLGMDGQLLLNADKEIEHGTLSDKLLITLLAKLSNFIPEAGIWLNTQRPEWNDANNALVGNGVSMVTLYYIRRFLGFCLQLFKEAHGEISVFSEVKSWMQGTEEVFQAHKASLSTSFSDKSRRSFIDGVGAVASKYRIQAYENGFSGNRELIKATSLSEFFELVLEYVDQSIRSNKRKDGLYHAYNLIRFDKDKKASIGRLYEMLEGQVSVLSSGLLSAREADQLLEALRKSSMYWEDQKSYLLYPDRQLPRFEEKNNIPKEAVEDSKLIKELHAADNNDLIVQDSTGYYHFNGRFNNADSVKEALTELREVGFDDLVEKEGEAILNLFEKVFDHQSFTGRSGTFFGYEGLGCIYWHMVSKLLLAAQENCIWALESNADPEVCESLISRYYEIRSGIGFNKTPDEYGAFPSDAYSHTPGSGGAKQPGMTGQVKEDILCRFGELGLNIKKGKIIFKPDILKQDEFLSEGEVFDYYSVSGQKKSIQLQKDQLAFTFNQVPIIYAKSDRSFIRIYIEKDVITDDSKTPQLDDQICAKLLDRSGEIERIEVHFDREFL